MASNIRRRAPQLRLNVTLSAARERRWQEAVDAEGDVLDRGGWALDRLREYGGWRWMNNKGVSPQLAAAASWFATGTPSTESEPEPGADPGWMLLSQVLGSDHHELCVELGRLAEHVSMSGASTSARLPGSTAAELYTAAKSARFAPALVDGVSLWGLPLELEEVEEFPRYADEWGFDSLDEWASACVDTILDRNQAPFGVREALTETSDDGASAAVLIGLCEELELWAESDEMTRLFLSDHIERTARWARMVLAVRSGR